MTALISHDLGVSLRGHTILEGVDIAVRSGEMLGLLGPNGAGKTTLLKALAGLLPTHGAITVGDKPFATFSAGERARHIAYLPQGTTAHWAMPVHSVVALGRLPHRRPGTPMSVEDERIVAQAMEETDVVDLKNRPVTSLSGGERARVLLARALAVKAPIMLTDEPVAYLDPRHQLGVMEVLARRAVQGGACIVVLHDLALAARYCHRVAVLHQGRLVAQGEPHRVMDETLLKNVFAIKAVAGQALTVPWEIASP